MGGGSHFAACIIASFSVRQPCGQRSMTMFPGPVSKAKTPSSPAPFGNTVMLPMPPMFCSATVRARVLVQKVLGVGHQRRAKTARSHIPHTEIADDRTAKCLTNKRCFADLQRTVDIVSTIFLRCRCMVDRLPMTSHKGNAVGVNTCLRADGQTGVSAEPAHQKVQKAQFLAASEIPRRHPQDAVAHGIGKRQRDKSQLAHLRSCRAATDLHQCGVNAIGRGAAPSNRWPAFLYHCSS